MNIPANQFHLVYLVIVTLLTIGTLGNYSKWYKWELPHKAYSFVVKALAATLAVWIGFRPINHIFVDTMNYYDHYHYLYYGIPFEFKWEMTNYIFDNLLQWMASQMMDITYFFLIIAVVYFGFMAWACLKVFPQDALLAFLMYLGAFSTFSYGTNGIKAGAAASVFLVALAYRNNLKIAIPLLWMSLGFHHSMAAPIAAFIAAWFIKKPKWYLYGWIVCLLLAAAHITWFMTLFAGFTDELGAAYLQADNVEKSVTGFRPDFILYSAVPIVLGYYLLSTKRIMSKEYRFLWCVYTLTNAVFLLCTYGDYINRIAYLSWLMYPFVLLYPFVKSQWVKRQDRYLRYVVYGHLAFTLFMSFIYYA